VTAISPWPDEGQSFLIEAATAPDAAAALGAWRSFLALARPLGDEGTWSLLPALYLNLAKRHGLAGFERREELRLQWMRTLLGNRQRFEVLDTVLPAFVAAGIPVIVFKGRAILELFYGDLGGRPCLDTDILVPPDRLQEAGRHLIGLGWTPKGGTLAEQGKAWEHALAFVDRSGRMIDLHAHVMHANCWPGIDDAAWRRSRPFAAGGAIVRSLSDGDHLIQTCAHGIREPTRAKVYWVADALLIVHRGAVDWPAVVETIRARHLSIPLAGALALLRDRFGAPVPAEALAEVRRMTTWADRLIAREGRRWAGTRRFLLYAQAHPEGGPLRRLVGFSRDYSGARNPVVAITRSVGRKAANGLRRLIRPARREPEA
jgi:hypothetical protein